VDAWIAKGNVLNDTMKVKVFKSIFEGTQREAVEDNFMNNEGLENYA
jgi:hypothetical protein